jgi:hypothetical protein
MLTGGCILKQTKINQRHFSWVFGALLAWFKLDIHMSVFVIMMLDILHSCLSLCFLKNQQSAVNANYVWTHKNNISFRLLPYFKSRSIFYFCVFLFLTFSLSICPFDCPHVEFSHYWQSQFWVFDTCGFPEGRHAITKKYKNLFQIAYKLLSE